MTEQAPEPRTFATIGVVGLGTMGAGIAEVFARNGFTVIGVELNDADPEVVGTLFEDTVNRRRYCDEGSFDLVGMVAALRDAGWQGPWGVEILSEEHRAMSVEDALTRAAEELGVDVRRCVVVGDIGSDVEAALTAGARAILVPTARTLPEEVELARRHAVVAPDLLTAARIALGLT